MTTILSSVAAPNVFGFSHNDYANAVINIGSLYALPVCDLYHNSGFNKLTLNSLTIDGLHPNLLGMIEEGSYLSGFISKV